MADWRDQLTELEAALGDVGQLTCPVCRLAQPAESATCERCGADLALLAGVLAEAARSKIELYQAIARGDAVAALGELDATAQLTGPSLELAVLRRLLRHGTVPLEVLGDLAPTPDDDAEPMAVYAVAPAPGDELLPDLDADPERAAFAGLWPAAEADLEPMPDIEPEGHNHHPAPEPATPPPPTPPPPVVVPSAPVLPGAVVWIMVGVATITLILGIGIGWMLGS